MTNVIDQLRAEHANIGQILNVLEIEAGNLDRTGRVDSQLLRDISSYFLEYPDACHHPKEDAVYRLLVAARPVSTGQVVDIEAEHREVSALAREFATAVQAHCRSEAGSATPLVEAAHRFVDVQRHHMRQEEMSLFPMALDALSDDDLATVDAHPSPDADPLFANLPDARYRRLHDKIVYWDAHKRLTADGLQPRMAG